MSSKSSLNRLIFSGLIFTLVSCSHGKQQSANDVAADQSSKSNKKTANNNSSKTNQFNNNWSNMGENKAANANPNANAKKNQTANESDAQAQSLEDNVADASDVNNDTSGLGDEDLVQQQANPQSQQSNNLPANPPIQNVVANQVPPNQGNALQMAGSQNAGNQSPPVNAAPPTTVSTALPPVVQPTAADVLPRLAELRWIGYAFDEKAKTLKIELITSGKPEFDVFQESNKAGQPELVVRFKQTSLRSKLKRDIDASEFRSPVAFVRTRFDAAQANTDVVLTLRDEVQPKLWAKDGNVLLTYAIPARYFGPEGKPTNVVTTAKILPNANISPVIEPGSESPGARVAAYVPDPAAQTFKDAPTDGGAPLVETSVEPETTSEEVVTEELPENPSDSNLTSTESGTEQQASAIPTGDPEMNDFAGAGAGANAGVNGIDFGGAENPGNVAVSANPNEPESQSQQEEDSENSDEEADEQNDEIDDFDDGEGESSQENEKFEVRERSIEWPSWSAFAVAQDDGEDEDFQQQGQQDAQQSNQQSSQQGQQQAANAANGQASGNQTSNAAPVNNYGANNSGGNNNLGANTSGNYNNSLNNGATPENSTNNLVGNGTDNAAEAALQNDGGNAALFGNSVSNTPPANLSATTMPAEAAVAVPAQAEPASDVVGSDAAMPPAASNAAGDNTAVMGINKVVTLEFRGAPLGEVIRVLSDESGINFLYQPTIGDRPVYLRLKNVTIESALNGLLETYGLGMVTLGPKLIRIDDLMNIARDRQNLQSARTQAARLEPTKIMIMRLNYLTADRAVALASSLLLGGGAAGGGAAPAAPAPAPGGPASAATPEVNAVDPRIRVSSELRTNSLIVEATEVDLARVKALMEKLDLPTPQIKLTSKLVGLRKTNSNEFGISWGDGQLNYDQRAGLGFGNLTFPNYAQARYAIDPGQVTPNLGARIRFGSINDVLRMDMILTAAETRGLAETIQSGEVTVEDNVEARLESGATDVFPMANGTSAGTGGPTAMPTIRYNTGVTVRPRVTNDGRVQMEIQVQNDAPAPPTASSVGAATGMINRLIRTTMIKRSGETAVIGGTFGSDRSKSVRGVPWLSWIPIIGALFRSQVTQEGTVENIWLVTPTVIASDAVGSAVGSTMPSATNYATNATSNVGQGTLNNQGNYQGNNVGNDQQNAGNNGTTQNSQNGNQNSQQSQLNNQMNQQSNSQNNANQQQQQQQQSNL